MSETISILHISDLHRSKDSKITNNALIATLMNDRDKYTTRENPKIAAPDLIIVSGDIIYGSKHPTNSEKEVGEQYDEALSFLNEITNKFLNGNKERIVIIPGNHDVSYKQSVESMEKIERSKFMDEKDRVKKDILRDSVNQDSPIRWSWNDLSFYKIERKDVYNKRLEAFSVFYSKFYDGKRHFSLDPDKQFDFFEVPDLNIAIVAYNSCYNNDHLRLSGDINPVCIADSNGKLAEFRKKGRLIIGTWHHNTKGEPDVSNYMDSRILKNFIDYGIAIGFHGHQHRTELISELSDVIEQKKLLIFSAGSLCSGPRELPTGTNKQYNLVEIKNIGSKPTLDVTLHVREKTESSLDKNPIWVPGRIDSRTVSYHTMEIEKPKPVSISRELIVVEQLINEKKFSEALKSLLSFDLSDPFVRKFLLLVVIELEDDNSLLKVFTPPQNTEEAIAVINYAIQKGSIEERSKILVAAKEYGSQNTVSVIYKRLEAISK